MGHGTEHILDCTAFERVLSDYLEKTLETAMHKAVASHALQCPLCHALLNDVKEAMAACHTLAEPRVPVSRLDAGILARTIPDSTIKCDEFEEYLTDYLDGFLPATVFHRWERHAILCDGCTDLPGEVVRSLAAIVNFKLDELPIPAGLHDRILATTLGTIQPEIVRQPLSRRFGEWVRGLRFPISIPQLTPVAAMSLLAFLTFSQTVSADGSLSDVYAKSYHLAEQTYRQGADVISEATGNRPEPIPAVNEPSTEAER